MVPHDAICFFQDGNQMCCVFGDFENVQVSPAGFGGTFQEAFEALLRDNSDPRKKFDRHLKEASRTVAAMPEWKRNILGSALGGKATNDTPRPYVDNTGDDGGF